MDFQPMSPDEMQRTMQFLLQQQAKFDAGMALLREKDDRISDALIGLTGIVGRIADRVERLAEAQQETDRQIRETDTHINDVESHLNVVMEMFERHLREDHGRKPS